METDLELRQAVHNVLIDLAVNDKLPLDITDLDIDSVFEQAEAKLKENKPYQERILLEKLGRFIHFDSDEEQDVLDTWNNLTSVNDGDFVDDHFTPWEKLEWSMTIKELVEQI